jgi:hypothetical protein
MGMVTELGLVEDFVQLAGWRSSILGTAGIGRNAATVTFSLMKGYLASEFQFGT